MRHLLSSFISIPVLVLLRHLAHLVPYTNQGFFCDDDEIRYPNRESTISSENMLVIYGTIIGILIPLCEWSLLRRLQRPPARVHFRRHRIHPFIVHVFFFYAVYTCGVLTTSVATNLFKRTSSRLRPNFIALCRPANLSTLCPLGSNAFIEEFTCEGESSADQHFSFPSSHASHSIFFLIFTILFTHRRLRILEPLRAFVQLGVFLLSVFICLSRVRDFKHRYTDVVGGGLLGGIIAVSMIHLVLLNMRGRRYNEMRDIVVEIGGQTFPVQRTGFLEVDRKSDYGSLSSASSTVY